MDDFLAIDSSKKEKKFGKLLADAIKKKQFDGCDMIAGDLEKL